MRKLTNIYRKLAQFENFSEVHNFSVTYLKIPHKKREDQANDWWLYGLDACKVVIVLVGH